MSRVRLLEDAVVDRIAAGEVVERPASVVKELVENSLDAGATRIEVHLKQGGVELVRVIDDGCGMDRDDALLCIERHATSKITSADDLLDVVTLGFRGEALPSIASVSRFELRTRRAEDEVGTVLKVDGGRLEDVGPWAGSSGTDVAVRSLFVHVPARRKFLRSRQTELDHCVETVRRLLIRRHDVEIVVRHDGREILRSPGGDDPVRRVRDLLGEDAGRLVPVEHAAGGVRVRGLVAPVGVHRPATAGAVYTHVRGRFVRDPVLRRAVQDAYRDALPAGRFPVVVLDVDVPPGTVDVNVHPAKTEVRFQRPREVVQAVTEAIERALHAAPRAPTRGVVSAAPVEQLELPPVAALPAAEQVAAWWAAAPPSPEPAAREALPSSDPAVPPVPTPPPAPRPEPPPAVPPPPMRSVRPAPADGGPTLLATLGRVGVARRGDALVLLDLGVARARALADRLRTGALPAMPLLVPARVPLGRVQAARVVAAAEALSDLGVEVSAFGPGELAVVALPRGVSADPAALLAAVDAALERGGDLADAVASVASSDEDVPLQDAPARVLDEEELLALLRERPA